MSENRSANVFIIEDDPNVAQMIRDYLSCFNHTVVGEASWLATAMNEIHNFGDLGVNIITLDRDLNGGDVINAGFVSQVRTKHPDIKIVGMGVSPMPRNLVHVDLTKDRIELLNKVVNSLMWGS